MESFLKSLASFGEISADLQDSSKRSRLFSQITSQKFDYSKYVAKGNKWFTKAKNDKVIANIVFKGNNESNFIVIGSLFCVLSGFVVLFSATNGSYMFIFGVLGTYVGLMMLNLPLLTLTPFALGLGGTLLVLNSLV